MALFNVKVKWAEYILYIVLNEETALIIFNSEVILKAVRDKAIIKMFSLKIRNVIIKSLVYKREL
jgi:hypothetical protein